MLLLAILGLAAPRRRSKQTNGMEEYLPFLLMMQNMGGKGNTDFMKNMMSMASDSNDVQNSKSRNSGSAKETVDNIIDMVRQDRDLSDMLRQQLNSDYENRMDDTNADFAPFPAQPIGFPRYCCKCQKGKRTVQ